MELRDRLEKEGTWLFRFRSYLPLLLLPVLILAFRHAELIERFFGDRVEESWEAFCFLVSLLGVGIRVMTIGYAAPGTSGRNTQRQKASVLNTTGLYSIVRHPLYLGNFFIFLGLSLLIEVWWFVIIALLGFWLYYERIMLAEERFLREKFGEAYATWASETPIFIAYPASWKRPDGSFDLKTVVKREASTLFATILCFTIFGVAMDLLAEERLEIDPAWIVLVVGSGLFYLVIRYLRKRTRFLAGDPG